MKKLLFSLATGFAALALFVGQLSVNMACAGEFYQPVVPKEMLKH